MDPDLFDRARWIAATALVLTGSLAILGCFLDWVTFSLDEPPGIRTSQSPTTPIAGTMVSDWKVVLVAAVVIVLCAVLLVLRGRSMYAWICFIASMVMGAIAVADYRGLDDPTSGFIRGLEHTLHTNVQGQAHPGLGLTIVAIAGIGGLIAAVVAIAATPRR
jgi:hypothetical protein